MANTLNRTVEEQIQEIDLQIAKVDEILAGQIQPSIDISDGDSGYEDALASYNNSMTVWNEQQTYWNQKRADLVAEKTQLESQ